MSKKKLFTFLRRIAPTVLVIAALFLGFFLGRYPFLGTPTWKINSLERLSRASLVALPSSVGKSLDFYLWNGDTDMLEDAKFMLSFSYYILHYPLLSTLDLSMDEPTLDKLTLFIDPLYNLMDTLIAEGREDIEILKQDERYQLLSDIYSRILGRGEASIAKVLANLETERGQEIFQALLAYQPT